jgi:hypothetical protein
MLAFRSVDKELVASLAEIHPLLYPVCVCVRARMCVCVCVFVGGWVQVRVRCVCVCVRKPMCIIAPAAVAVDSQQLKGSSASAGRRRGTARCALRLRVSRFAFRTPSPRFHRWRSRFVSQGQRVCACVSCVRVCMQRVPINSVAQWVMKSGPIERESRFQVWQRRYMQSIIVACVVGSFVGHVLVILCTHITCCSLIAHGVCRVLDGRS